MQIISTNIGIPTIINLNGKEHTTGIYKMPVKEPVYLGKEDVVKDHVIDRKVHGGHDKACYIYSEKHYSYWKNLYPLLDWDWGMFGENLSISDLDESEIFIGDIYKIGEAIVQVSQPRQPCFKLGVRFGTMQMVKQFVEFGYPGVYLRVLTMGQVKNGDKFELVEKEHNSLSIKDIFRLIYQNEQEDKSLVIKAINIKTLAQSCKNDLTAHWNL
jgi:MOSC domain-containing protein YiiM